MKILYIDAGAGASGDMLAGAMLDLGWPLPELERHIETMGLKNEARVQKLLIWHQGIKSCRLQVELLHPEHGHDHSPEPGHGRRLPQIKQLLALLPAAVAEPAALVFQRLAQAEAAVHGIAENEVHFHEVGAVDAIVDVVAFCGALAWLAPQRLICSPLPLGQGYVDCSHGRLPLPAPATLKLLAGIPVRGWPENNETVTPTGAALLATLCHEFGPLPAFRLQREGVGGGSRINQGQANIARLLLGEADSCLTSPPVAEINCNLDNQIGEDFPALSAALLQAGALDVSATPLLMKKGRPGLQINVLCPPASAPALAAVLLEQSPTLGVRLQIKERLTLPRRIFNLNTPWGEVRIKEAITPSGQRRCQPEAEDVLALCRQTGFSPAQVRQKITALLEQQNE